MTAVLSEKSLNVINAIILNPGSNPAEVSKYLGVTIATVTGALQTLKKCGLVTIEEGKLIPSAEAEFEYGGGDATIAEQTVPSVESVDVPAAVTSVVSVPTAVTKASLARPVFEANKTQPRKVLMNLLMDPSVGLSSHGANTYLYNMRKLAGMVTVRAAKVITGEEPSITE